MLHHSDDDEEPCTGVYTQACISTNAEEPWVWEDQTLSWALLSRAISLLPLLLKQQQQKGQFQRWSVPSLGTSGMIY